MAPESDSRRAAQQLKRKLLEQQRRLDACDQRFMAITRQYRKLAESAEGSPAMARVESEALVTDSVQELLGNTESVISLLSDGVGERNALHPVNVMVLCLLMGKAQGLSPMAMQDLGMAALLHDIGKLRLPAALSSPFPGMTPQKRRATEAMWVNPSAWGRAWDCPKASCWPWLSTMKWPMAADFPQAPRRGTVSGRAHSVAGQPLRAPVQSRAQRPDDDAA